VVSSDGGAALTVIVSDWLPFLSVTLRPTFSSASTMTFSCLKVLKPLLVTVMV